MIADLLTRTCTVTRRTASGDTDAYGNEVPDEAVEQTPCEVQQSTRAEPGGEGETSDTTWAGYFLPDLTLGTGDIVTVDGIGTLEVVGEPWKARDPFSGGDHHIEASLRRTAGGTEGEGS